MAADRAVEQFGARITHAFSQKLERIEDQIDFDHKYQHLATADYDDALRLINTVKRTETLVALMTAYLDLFARYHANTNLVHYHRSDDTFAELIERSLKVPAETRDLYRDWKAILEGSAQSSEFAGLKPRFDELGPTARSRVVTFFRKERDRRAKTQTILDVLRSEYLARYGFAPTHDDALEDLDPYPGAAFRSQFDEQFAAVDAAWRSAFAGEDPDQRKAFEDAFKAFDGYLAGVSKIGPLPVFQVIAFLRDKMARKVERVGWGTIVTRSRFEQFVPELYVAACMRLLVVASRQLALSQNRFGFTDDEFAFFLRPIAGNALGYDSDVAKRLSARPDNAVGVTEWSNLFLQLLLLTHFRHMQLVNFEKTIALQANWAVIDKALHKLASDGAVDESTQKAVQAIADLMPSSVQITTGEVLGQGEVFIGSTLGERPDLGEAKVVAIEPRSLDLYVEFEQYRPFLFRIDTGTAHQWLFDARKAGIHRSTVGMTYVTEGIVTATGFLPALVEGGVAGLVYEVGVYAGSVGVEKVVSEINPTAGKVLGFLAGLVIPRPKFGPKVVVPAERTVKIISVEAPEVSRSIEEAFRADEQAARSIEDLSRITLTGKVQGVLQATKDAAAAAYASVGGVLGEVPRLGETALTDQGLMHRVEDAPAARAGGGRGRGTGGDPAAAGRASRLERTQEFKDLEDYLPMLEEGDQITTRRLRREVVDKVRRGLTRYGDGRKQLTNLLNHAKETTGEYVADGLVYSSYKVRRVVTIPRRNAKVPILDRVYEVESPDRPGEVFYVFAEIKGGRRTRLGSVSDKSYSMSAAGELAERTLAGRIRQADPKWYFQKLVEMGENGATAAEIARNRALARELFDAAKAGKVESLVVKSGSDLDPFVKIDENFTKGFQNLVLPWDLPKRGR